MEKENIKKKSKTHILLDEFKTGKVLTTADIEKLLHTKQSLNVIINSIRNMGYNITTTYKWNGGKKLYSYKLDTSSKYKPKRVVTGKSHVRKSIAPNSCAYRTLQLLQDGLEHSSKEINDTINCYSSNRLVHILRGMGYPIITKLRLRNSRYVAYYSLKKEDDNGKAED